MLLDCRFVLICNSGGLADCSLIEFRWKPIILKSAVLHNFSTLGVYFFKAWNVFFQGLGRDVSVLKNFF